MGPTDDLVKRLAAYPLTENAARIDTLERDLAASQAEVERLREALNWYADQNNYKLRIDDDGRWYPSRVILDDGARARAAITRQKSMSRTTDGEMG